MLIVGLGNPGPAYADTRHNIGFMVIDALLKRVSAQPSNKASFEGELSKTVFHYYLKPTTYMNLSGRSIAAVKNFYKIEEVIVIHDDLDLPFGALKFKRGGGHGGHNGLKSADLSIGSDYTRVRMGIGKPEHKGQVADYVLSPFLAAEQEHLSAWIEKTADAVEMLCETPLDQVASKCSIKKIELK